MTWIIKVVFVDEHRNTKCYNCSNRTEYYHMLDLITDHRLKSQIDIVYGYHETKTISKIVFVYEPLIDRICN